MNSFQIRAIGNLANNPELIQQGEHVFAKFCLIGNDYAGKDEQGQAREITTALYLIAFGSKAVSIAKALKGDQLIVEAHVRANNWTPADSQETVYEYSFVVDDFKFGAPGKAKRAEFGQRG